jgi:hypothetical protein
MARFEENPPPGSEWARQDQAIFALLRSKSKVAASRASGIALRTIFRWLADPDFMVRLRAARRAVFDDALFALERNAEAAANRLADEMEPGSCSGIKRAPNLISAAKGLLDRAFKAQGVIAVEEEMAEVRITLAKHMAGEEPGSGPEAGDELSAHADDTLPFQQHGETPMAADDQIEAARLRVAWMTEIGMDGHAIEASLRYNRPQTVAEEQYLLDAVQKTLEFEAMHEQAMIEYSQAAADQ